MLVVKLEDEITAYVEKSSWKLPKRSLDPRI